MGLGVSGAEHQAVATASGSVRAPARRWDSAHVLGLPFYGANSWLDAETPASRVQVPHAGPFDVWRVGALANSPRNNVLEILADPSGLCQRVIPAEHHDARQVRYHDNLFSPPRCASAEIKSSALS